MHRDWRTRLASAVVLLLGMALGVRVADALLAPLAVPLLLLGCLAGLYLVMARGRR